MIREIPLSRSIRIICAAGLGLLALPVLAQEAAPETVQRVEITGSSIKRLVSETANPLTVFKAEEFAKQGLTTAQEVLSKIPSNASSLGSGNAVGGNTSGLPTGGQASADLRGLGGDKTLVLLNGRRIANHPYDGASVDLNIIPISALDRVEVLRDGASAIYGTDAIGGVINFITKRSINVTNITAELITPEHKGGAEQRINLSSGFGKLDTQGYNIFGVLDYHKQGVLTSQDRDFSKTGIIPNRGLALTSGTTFPGNYFDPGSGVTGNPGFASGCNPPLSVPGNGTCRQDYTRQIDDLPKQEQLAFFGKGAFKLGDGHLATVEYLHSENKVQSRTAPPPQIELVLPNTSKYYPGNPGGGVPAQAGLSGQPLIVNWRPTEAGQRQIDSKGTADRLVLALEGELAGWDYKTGLTYSISKSAENFTGGYVQDASFAAGVRNGILNPFAAQDAAGAAYLASTALRGEVQNAKVTTTGFDIKGSRELTQLAGGPLAIALGGELRHEKAAFNVNRDIASQATSSGLSGSQSKDGSRNIEAVFGEVNLPLIKDLEVNLAVRFDNYSDVGNTTNPKLGVRYQASKQVVLRGSASTGFRAPTLFEKNAPPSKNDTNDSYDDPILCPGGKPTPAANPLRDCDLQQFKLQGGNANLKPEKSKTFAFGVVLEPIPEITVALDYWNIHLKDKIAALPEQSIYGNYEKYKALFLRNPDGSPYAILDLNDNLGEVKTDGIDVSLNARLPRTNGYGDFSLSVDGTYVHKYDYQNERDGAFISNVGRYADNNPVFRWKHTAALNWRLGNWGATVSQTYKSRYTDQNNVDAQYQHDVSSYSLWNLSGSYTGFKGVLVTAGVKNLFDKEPPFSNQGSLFQKGYDPRYTDPVGRAFYLRGSYTF
ncbi:TonB-dependent receptor [Janthinobacterium agaricidamnosum]|uniref:TonB-dependent Receptor Plug domain protein n=1 Tax=Janthinobacterium agaricidamnosum NBRC 102515 = DSM 9628 TaxID=1349767 RepID=W0VAK8_9BURK|nr:TonB-dependent receptor [Janthinobacterium agaricidamnosum]CDG84916.1 tonB-dependent Receptor Plug domain protein [Janthinobacterium agaricidamnosum NBRC 102515 = DSM 9628]